MVKQIAKKIAIIRKNNGNISNTAELDLKLLFISISITLYDDPRQFNHT
jgi:hypothetical protein